MKVIRTIAGIRETIGPERQAGRTIGFVPTMGWFHEGHVSLMRRARSDCDIVVVSLFVNPTQFTVTADFDGYPRDEQRDARMASEAGVDVLFVPAAAEMYPAGSVTTVVVDRVTEPLEGAARGAAHFRGVATVVLKLFNIVQPDIAYFGQKDAQQTVVVRQMARDLDVPVRVEVCPTVREADGLAMSSRNVRLAPEDRPRALALRRALDAARAAIIAGERRASVIEAAGRTALRSDGIEPDYFAVTSADTLESRETVHGTVLISVAAPVGRVRLIDNDVVAVP